LLICVFEQQGIDEDEQDCKHQPPYLQKTA